jgi:hypothetical protein
VRNTSLAFRWLFLWVGRNLQRYLRPSRKLWPILPTPSSIRPYLLDLTGSKWYLKPRSQPTLCNPQVPRSHRLCNPQVPTSQPMLCNPQVPPAQREQQRKQSLHSHGAPALARPRTTSAPSLCGMSMWMTSLASYKGEPVLAGRSNAPFSTR